MDAAEYINQVKESVREQVADTPLSNLAEIIADRVAQLARKELSDAIQSAIDNMPVYEVGIRPLTQEDMNNRVSPFLYVKRVAPLVVELDISFPSEEEQND